MRPSPHHDPVQSPIAAELLVDDLARATTALIAVLLTEPNRTDRLRGSARRVSDLANQLHGLAELLAGEGHGGRARKRRRTGRPSV